MTILNVVAGAFSIYQLLYQYWYEKMNIRCLFFKYLKYLQFVIRFWGKRQTKLLCWMNWNISFEAYVGFAIIVLPDGWPNAQTYLISYLLRTWYLCTFHFYLEQSICSWIYFHYLKKMEIKKESQSFGLHVLNAQ